MTSLERTLAELEHPKAHLAELTGQSVFVRLYGWPPLHRAVPTWVALRLAALRGLLEWYAVARRRAEGLALARATHGRHAGPREGRRRVVEDAVQAEVQWRPWLARRMPIEGFEHFIAARERSPAGVILANVHVGPLMGLVHALAARGFKLYLPGGDWGGGAASRHGRAGRWTFVQNRWVEDAGSRWVPTGGSYPVLRALLERGETLILAADVRGDVDVELGAHPARVRSGIAQLALDTGSPILPVTTLRRGDGLVGLVGEAIDPAAYSDAAELTRRVTAALGHGFREAPEQVRPYVARVWAASRRPPPR